MIDPWETIEAEAHERACDAYDRDWAIVMSSAQLQLALRCSEVALDAARRAEGNLADARDRAQMARDAVPALGEECSPEERREAAQRAHDAETSVLAFTVLAVRSLEWLRRTTVTLEQAIQLHSMGR